MMSDFRFLADNTKRMQLCAHVLYCLLLALLRHLLLFADVT